VRPVENYEKHGISISSVCASLVKLVSDQAALGRPTVNNINAKKKKKLFIKAPLDGYMRFPLTVTKIPRLAQRINQSCPLSEYPIHDYRSMV